MPGPLEIANLSQKVSDFARTYLWLIQFPVLLDGSDKELLQALAETTAIPGVGNEPIELSYMAMKMKIAGRQNFEHTFPATFKETTKLAVTRAFLNWHKKITHNVTGVGMAPDVYKLTGKFHLLAPDASVIASFTAKGVWPENMDAVDLSYEDSAIIKRSVTFSFDTWDLD